jgi:hypothetical protein
MFIPPVAFVPVLIMEEVPDARTFPVVKLKIPPPLFSIVSNRFGFPLGR